MKNVYLLFLILVFTGCKSTLPVADFKTDFPLTGLNGTFMEKNGSLTMVIPKLFQDTALQKRSIDNVGIRFNGKDSVSFSFFSQDTLLRQVKYKGEVKDNFFEIKLEWKTIIAFPLFTNYVRDRLRLGLTDDNHLITHYWHHNTGGIFLLMGGYETEYKNTYERIARKSNHDWYDFVTAPDIKGNYKGVAEGKWTLLDSSGNKLTRDEYDYIDHYDHEMDGYRITVNNEDHGTQMGYIDTQGNVIIPAEYYSIQDTEIPGVKRVGQYKDYESLRYQSSPTIHWGFITRQRVICPPVLLQVLSEFKSYNKKGLDPESKYCKVVYNRDDYLLGLDGYLYPYSSFMGIKKIKPYKAIKVGYDFNEKSELGK